MAHQNITLDDFDALLFDFDGVLTNNLVHLSQDGKESVSCSRADGLAFDVLRKLKKPAYIISSEINTVVTARALKLQIKALQGVSDKVLVVDELIEKENFDISKILYVGNDLNDFNIMQKCEYTACPADSHHRIKQIATYVLKTKGGKGVVRELLEDVFELDIVHILSNRRM